MWTIGLALIMTVAWRAASEDSSEQMQQQQQHRASRWNGSHVVVVLISDNCLSIIHNEL